MNRREIVAGVGSVGVPAGAGGLFRYGPPSVGTDEPSPDDGTEDDESGPITVETINARGSEAGSVTVPDGETVTVATFFVTGCGNCQAQIPRLATAREQLRDECGDAVRFLAVTYQERHQLPESDLRDWWATHDGNGLVGYDSGLAGAYGVVGYPVTVALFPDGEKRWRDLGVLEAETIVDEVGAVLEADTDCNDDRRS
ncbi:TlpA disulfide reductase family protein [Natronolimnohabitans sp. A-GB9]|uniref:TlpA family protein disulfide reductase n=1 Tax=Natronolimnohabitans sp. A-GB9 TaxID=3069757 RepID=UPI0027B5BC16|nr:TlpA disulfide reductase family protein [Natronolimnohabitans sp. A-GB9]MDQ2049178.1 TlpA disulfide reductase family protein [Natronolimnohabitans sp. A-GB9]